MDDKTLFAIAEMMSAAYGLLGVEVDVIDVTILRPVDLGKLATENTEGTE